jgi:LPXTG-motif cell wall-anchored protein
MKRRFAQAAVAAVALASIPVGLRGFAEAANCGGQGAAPRPTPYTCTLPYITIDGTVVGAVVRANGNAPVKGVSGTGVEVIISIKDGTPTRTVPTSVRIVHHEGISGAGGAFDEASGVMAPGQRTILLRDSAACRAGQLDIKFVFTGNGEPAGRIGGPWIENGTGCDSPPTTPPTTAAPPTTPPTTITATPPGAPPVTPNTPTTPPANRPPTPPGDRLPETGRDEGPALVAAVLMLAAGVALLILRGRKPIST